jgi:hypothetical protein
VESITVSDAEAGGALILSALAESINVSNTQSAQRSTSGLIFEAIDNLYDVTDAIASMSVAVYELAQIASAPFANAIFPVSTTEQINVSATQVTARNQFASIDEEINVSDLESATAAKVGSITEAISVNGISTTQAFVPLSISESISCADSVSALREVYGTASESITAQSSVDAIFSYVITVSERVNMLAAQSAINSTSASIAEQVNASSVQTIGKNNFVTQAESVNLSDSEAAARFVSALVAQSVGLLDAYETNKAFPVNVDEVVFMQATHNAIADMYVNMAEAMTAQDRNVFNQTYTFLVLAQINASAALSIRSAWIIDTGSTPSGDWGPEGGGGSTPTGGWGAEGGSGFTMPTGGWGPVTT